MSLYTGTQISPTPFPPEFYTNAAAITPTDNTTIGPYWRIYVGGAGDVAAILAGNSVPVTFKSVAAGSFLPPALVVGINATGTTATYLVGLA